jgi:hypothetical protein
MCTARLPVVDWTDAPTDLNGLVRFAEKRNLVSVRVPSRFKSSLLCLHPHRHAVVTGITFQPTKLLQLKSYHLAKCQILTVVVTKDASTVMVRHVDSVNSYQSFGVSAWHHLQHVVVQCTFLWLTNPDDGRTMLTRIFTNPHGIIFQTNWIFSFFKIRVSIGENATGRKIVIFMLKYVYKYALF